jgi:hypothetical protein
MDEFVSLNAGSMDPAGGWQRSIISGNDIFRQDHRLLGKNRTWARATHSDLGKLCDGTSNGKAKDHCRLLTNASDGR